MSRLRSVLCALAVVLASALRAEPYGPPPAPPLPDGYAREARETVILWRPPTKGRTLLVVAGDEPTPKDFDRADLLQLARARNMTIAFLSAGRKDALALRPALASLRGGLKVVGAGEQADADTLQSVAKTKGDKLFDALLLTDAAPQDLGVGAPLIVELYGADAFWRDAPPPAAAKGANVRRYFLGGAVTEPGDSKLCSGPVNDRSIAPAERALLAALDDFIHGGPAPPPSREADLAPKKNLAWPKIPGAAAPPQGDGLAPKIDADGNETSGLRLPDQALPLATFTGWSPQKGDCRAGARYDFPPSREAREKSGDPRQSLVERYGSRAYFVAALRSVADKLVKERLLLPQDADAYVAAGKKAPF